MSPAYPIPATSNDFGHTAQGLVIPPYRGDDFEDGTCAVIGIGAFARLGRVSVRMLRHYDAIGLLVPAHVDPATGYRYYDGTQVRRLNRIVALKDLGLRLEQVRSVVDEQVGAADLRAMLRLRQVELESQIADSEHRLHRVRARLRLIDIEDDTSTHDVTTTTSPELVGHGLSAVAASATHEDIGPVISPLFGEVVDRLRSAGVAACGPAVSYYTPDDDETQDALRVTVMFPTGVDELTGLERVVIPAASVCSLIHRGSMDGIDATYQLLRAWTRSSGWTETGCAREFYLEVPDDSDDWVTEVQVDITR